MKNCRFLNLQDTGIFLAVRYGCDLDIIRRVTFEELPSHRRDCPVADADQ